ncbi:MAG: hypothetical protein ABL986_06200 [Vicinamibacterales bacterium]
MALNAVTSLIRHRLFLVLGVLAAVAVATPASAQGDIAGEWAARAQEDQPHRGPGAELGDYTGLPINAAARQKASVWDASILSLPEAMAKPHPAMYFMRGPGPNIRIQKIADPTTQVVIAYTIEGVFGRADRVIWMDGRPHPSEYAEYTFDGFSTGKVEGSRLTVTTTHAKYGVIQRNGVPASTKAVMTEHFIRHGDWLTLVTIVDDPVYLEEPFIRTSHWVRTSNVTPDGRFIFEVVDEVAGHPQGYVPHSPLGTRQDGFAKNHGLPFEATQGGKATLYPEYEAVIRKQLQDMAASRPTSK